jgi:1,4-alpha-glucan branching enzyme
MPVTSSPRGYFAPVLHAHLPYVRHPEYADCLEEDWLYEAITETYLPLLRMMARLQRDGVRFRLTMVLTPTLCTMLEDPLLQQRYVAHLESLIDLAHKEIERTRSTPAFHAVALMYRDRLTECHREFTEVHRGRLVEAFRAVAATGSLEIVTCCATHGFLPLMRVVPEAARAQVQVGVAHHKATFGTAPRGIWLPECGYYPGADELLKEAGIRYFFLDAHGVLFADRRPAYGVFAPVYCPSGVAAFGRDMESSRSVWSAQDGYPGDPRYREFYRDIGYDLDYEYIRPYIHESGIRKSTGLKYHRITGKVGLHAKEPYDPRAASEAAAQHAGNFLFNRQQQVLHLSGLMDRPPLITSPYDAELFGHWWYEGPEFLDLLIRKMACDQDDVELTTPSEYLERFPVNQVTTPSESSWGNKGYAEVWLDGSNDWIYRHLNTAAERMVALAHRMPAAEGIERRALDQAARELLLAQASDWAFIMKMNTMVHYAIKRTKDHLVRFNDLHDMLVKGTIDPHRLAVLEEKDRIFPGIDYRVYAGKRLV